MIGGLTVVLCFGLGLEFLRLAAPMLPASSIQLKGLSLQAASQSPPEQYDLLLQQEKRYPLEEEATHIHRVYLQESYALDVSFAQEGVDVGIDVFDPQGQKFLPVDSPSGDNGVERAFLVAKASGVYELVVRGSTKGSYLVRVESIRPATEKDQINARAETYFYYAREIRSQAPGSAIEYLQKAVALWQQTENVSRRANAVELIGRVYAEELDAWGKALPYFQDAGDLYRALRDAGAESRTLSFKGWALRELGRWDETEEAYNRAIDLVANNDELHEEAAIAYSQRGILRRQRGDNLKALVDFENSVFHWQKAGTHPEKRVKALSNVIYLKAQLDNESGALQSAAQELSNSPDLAPELKAVLYSKIAGVYRINNDLLRAQNNAELALRLRYEGRDLQGIPNDLVELSLIHRDLRNLDLARKQQEEALLLYRSEENPTGEATALANLGMILYEQGDFRQAEDSLKESLRIAIERGMRPVQAAALYTLALVSHDKGNHSEAKRRALEALKLVDSDKEKKLEEELGQLYFETRRNIYDLVIKLSATPDARQISAADLRLIVETFEKGRRRKMLEGLGEPPPRTDAQGTSSELLAKKEALELVVEDLRGWEGKLKSTKQPVDLVQAEIKRSLRDLEALDTRLRLNDPWYSFAKLPTPITLSQVLELLDKDVLLVMYELMESRSFAIVLTPSTQEIFELPPREKIEKEIKDFGKLLLEERTGHGREAVDRAGKRLSKTLFGPFAHRLGSSKLAIVPDGLINDLAFSALPRPEDSDLLIQKNEIIIVPSASVLWATRGIQENREPPQGPPAIFAVEYFQDLPPLKYVKDEATKISTVLKDEQSPPFVVLDNKANEEIARSKTVGQSRIVHFATHASSHPKIPELSKIVLSGGDLTAREIQDMDLRADLVVLSACETVRGVEVDGEGQVGLAHAFLYAGASRVVASLWKVDDKATSIFMERFYQEMKGKDSGQGRSPADALRATQIWMNQETKWKAPYYWAGFQIIGEWR